MTALVSVPPQAEKPAAPAKPVKHAKVRRKGLPVRAVTRPLFRSVVFAMLAGLLGASMAALMVYAAPGVTAQLAGRLYCADQSAAAVGTLRGPKLSELHPKAPAVQLEAQTLSCTASDVEAAPFRADLAWYGTWAAGAGGMTVLVYWMWVITSTLAFRPDPEADAKREPREDLPARFLEECCDVAPKQRAPAAQLYAAYAAWSRALGHYPPSAKDLHREWKRLGLKRRGLLKPNAWRGVRLKEQF